MLTRKKFVSVLLVVVCLAALTLPVFATEGAYPLTTMLVFWRRVCMKLTV